MIRGRCPICSKTFEVAALGDLPSFPFCSARCRWVDVGRWIDGAYAIPGSTNAQTQAPDEFDDRPDESDD
jgi:uncharacterized protein